MHSEKVQQAMKAKALQALALVIAICIGYAVEALLQRSDWHNEPQLAAGEWSIELQHPPCDSVHNIEVIFPKDGDSPIKIECNQMPVKTK